MKVGAHLVSELKPNVHSFCDAANAGSLFGAGSAGGRFFRTVTEIGLETAAESVFDESVAQVSVPVTDRVNEYLPGALFSEPETRRGSCPPGRPDRWRQ